MSRQNYLFTSESVSEGHPDKVCDRISDEIVEGAIAEGEQVPSINEFATAWRINPATALKGDTSTDQQHDHDAPHRGGQQ